MARRNEAGAAAAAGVVARVDRSGAARRVRSSGLTGAGRQLFLNTLAETCCVATAIAAAGVSASSLYARRRRDAVFAAEWLAALTIGYDAIEARLIAYVMANGDAPAGAAGRRRASAAASPERVPAWVQVALALTSRHRATVEGGKAIVKGARPTAAPVSAAETDAVLGRRLDQLARTIKRRG